MHTYNTYTHYSSTCYHMPMYTCRFYKKKEMFWCLLSIHLGVISHLIIRSCFKTKFVLFCIVCVCMCVCVCTNMYVYIYIYSQFANHAALLKELHTSDRDSLLAEIRQLRALVESMRNEQRQQVMYLFVCACVC